MSYDIDSEQGARPPEKEGGDVSVQARMRPNLHLTAWHRRLIIGAAVIYTIVLLFVFPLVASVSNTNWAMLKNSFFIGTHYLFCTILVFAVHFAMGFAMIAVFFPLIVLGEGLCALVSAHLMNNVLLACSYDPDAAEDDEEEDGDEA